MNLLIIIYNGLVNQLPLIKDADQHYIPLVAQKSQRWGGENPRERSSIDVFIIIPRSTATSKQTEQARLSTASLKLQLIIVAQHSFLFKKHLILIAFFLILL